MLQNDPELFELSMSEKTQPLMDLVKKHCEENIKPIQQEYSALQNEKEDRWSWHPRQIELMEGAKEKARELGLWNFFLPDPDGNIGDGLTNLDYTYVASEIGKYPLASESMNCSAPDTGNMEVLERVGTEEQKKQWLEPLLNGEIRSAYAMTEPNLASSDAKNISTSAVLDGDEWVINGHKWFTSNGHAADFYIVMCRTSDESDPSGENSKMTQIIVPKNTPGVNVVRGVPVWGKPSSHCEIVYDNVRVPKENQLGQTGSGHQAAQDRLGAGRVYHCMNSIGSMWRAFDLMVSRLKTREVHGGEKLADKHFMQGFVADSYIDIQSARLMTIHCAEKMESGDDPRTDISAIKVYVPNAYHRVVDRAIQVYGAAGVSGDLPLAGMYEGARTLRIADGPDEVHKVLIAKLVMRQYEEGDSWDFGN